MEKQDPIETGLATLVRTSEHLLEARFKPHVRISAAGMAEFHAARIRLCGKAPYVLLSILPLGVQIAMDAMGQDNYVKDRPDDPLRAIAVVPEGNMEEMMTRLYDAYFPQPFATGVFSSEAEARAWLSGRMQEFGWTTDPVVVSSIQ